MIKEIRIPGEHAFFKEMDPAHADATAAQKTDCIEIGGARLRAGCEQDPKFGYELIKKFAAVIGERLQNTRKRLIDPTGEYFH